MGARRFSYRIPSEDWFDVKMNRHNMTEAFTRIEDALLRFKTEKERHRFRESCLGHLMDMDWNMSYSTTLSTSILFREIEHDGPSDEMRFRMGNKYVLKLSRIEFCLITGLKFGPEPNLRSFIPSTNSIHQRYFHGRPVVCNDDIIGVLSLGEFSRPYDGVKLSLLLLLRHFVWGVDRRSPIPLWIFGLVEDLDAFDRFPWGNLIFGYSIEKFREALHRPIRRANGESHCNIYGFSWVLQILAFEMISEARLINGVRQRLDMQHRPRICHWAFQGKPNKTRIGKIFNARMYVLESLAPKWDEASRWYFTDILVPLDTDIIALSRRRCHLVPLGSNDREGNDYDDGADADVDDQAVHCDANRVVVPLDVPRKGHDHVADLDDPIAVDPMERNYRVDMEVEGVMRNDSRDDCDDPMRAEGSNWHHQERVLDPSPSHTVRDDDSMPLRDDHGVPQREDDIPRMRTDPCGLSHARCRRRSEDVSVRKVRPLIRRFERRMQAAILYSELRIVQRVDTIFTEMAASERRIMDAIAAMSRPHLPPLRPSPPPPLSPPPQPWSPPPSPYPFVTPPPPSPRQSPVDKDSVHQGSGHAGVHLSSPVRLGTLVMSTGTSTSGDAHLQQVHHVHVAIPRRISKKRDLSNRVYASNEARAEALEKAEKLELCLEPAYPIFIKSILQSHVTGGFWLGLPRNFCKKCLPKKDEIVTLIDESGDEYPTVYVARKAGLSSGWKGFAVAHDLVHGDAVVFQLIKCTTFKVYIIRVNSCAKQEQSIAP